LASAYVVHIRELGSNLSADKIFSKIRPVLWMLLELLLTPKIISRLFKKQFRMLKKF
jgi:hypothetical protein